MQSNLAVVAAVALSVAAILRERSTRVEELKVSEARLRVMVENFPAGAVYVARNRLFVNRATETITGYRREELQSIDDLVSQPTRPRP